MRNQRQGRGCLFYGCLTMVLVFIGVMAGMYFGTRQAVIYAVSRFTTNAPASIPRLDITAAEQESILKSVEQRTEEILRSQAPMLSLNERELNVLLNRDRDFGSFSNQIYLTPKGTQLQAQVSLSLDQFELWRVMTRRLFSKDLKGRYFNGLALLEPGLSNGVLTLRVQDLVVNGESLPEDFTSRLKNVNLTAGFTNNESRPLLNRLQGVEIRDSQLVLHLSESASAPSPQKEIGGE